MPAANIRFFHLYAHADGCFICLSFCWNRQGGIYLILDTDYTDYADYKTLDTDYTDCTDYNCTDYNPYFIIRVIRVIRV
jgi:hypothetical protein